MNCSKKKWILFAAVAACFAAAPGCSRETKVRAANSTVKMEPPADPDVFNVDNPRQFELTAAESRETHDTMDVNGVVAADVSRNVPVNSLSAGRVTSIGARLGDDVKKGQLLLEIASNDLALAFADYQKSLSEQSVNKRALERARDLFDHGAAAAREVESAEDAAHKSDVDVKTNADKIRILGGSVDHPSPVVELRAPVSGTIVDQQVQTATGVKSLDNSPALFTIADLSEVWVLCDVYENNLANVRLGDFAEVRFTAYPDRVFKARVSNISSVLDPNTRTTKVRLQLPNPQRMLRPGMFATARFASQYRKARVVVPSTAVLRIHDQDWVFRPAAQNQFRRSRVETAGPAGDGFDFIASGIQPGDQVVKGALQFSSAVEK
jgi:cobalt-zinc-cadmium efflux system membrane fusion protein